MDMLPGGMQSQLGMSQIGMMNSLRSGNVVVDVMIATLVPVAFAAMSGLFSSSQSRLEACLRKAAAGNSDTLSVCSECSARCVVRTWAMPQPNKTSISTST